MLDGPAPAPGPARPPTEAFLPLAGIRVLDFSHVIAGPLATLHLAQLGARVTKVENRRGGDVMRRTAQGMAAYVALNAGKEVVALDLADPADQAAARELAAASDVLMDNLRPGVLAGFGLGPQDLQSQHPGLVYCSVSGFGQHGALAGRPAYDHVVQAATGMMLTGGREGDGPVKTGFPLVDTATGLLAALAIVSALRERDQTGRGRFIDVAMSAAALQLMYPMACGAMTYGRAPARVGNQGFSGSPASDVFQTADGPFALGANTPRQFIALLQVLGCPEWADDPALFEAPLRADAPAEFLKARDPALLHQRLAERLAGWPAADLEAACAAARVPGARVRNLAEFTGQAQADGGLASVELADGGVRVISPGLGFRVR